MKALSKILLLSGLFALAPVMAQSVNWDSNPSNWNNSVSNWDNNPSNAYTNNGVYNNQGQRIGYETKAPSGVTNVYDNNGNRVGYSPSK